MPRSSVEDPLKAFRFVVEVDGMARAGFSECAGLDRTTEATEYREGGDNETPKKSAGISKFSNLTLKRGQIMDEGQNDFLAWARDVYDVNVIGGVSLDYRRDIEIVQFGRLGVEARRWRVHECFPVKFKPMSDLTGLTSDNSIEELEIACEGFELV